MATAFPRFDLLKSPLNGANLIEASAGTGKTYAIAGLYLRLLLEQRLTPSQILVVTYTVAATEELRDRIRNRMRDALDALSGKVPAEPFLEALIGGIADRKDAKDRLREALRSFDEASIFTIHSFCRRVLGENAFESGSPFEMDLLTDERPLREAVVCDFWRRHFYEAPPEFVHYVRGIFKGPVSFLEMLRGAPFRDDVRIIPDAHPVGFRGLDAVKEAFAALRESWPASRDGVEAVFRSEALNRNRYGKWARFLESMDAFLARPWAILPPPKDLAKFAPQTLADAVRKGRSVPTHPFFDLFRCFDEKAVALMAEMDGQIRFLRCELFRYVREELSLRKQRLNLRCYDDLLTDLQRALASAGGEALSEAVRRRYRAALIDEFQDTDPVQFAIFESVFGRAEGTLFLIGDPKQAIYSFRGADLFAYIRAASCVDRRYTLAENWRSEPDLIRAVNTLFARPEHPFLYEAVPFEAARAADREAPELTIDGRRDAPLKLWILDGGGGTIGMAQARDRIRHAVAAEIARLIEKGRRGEARIGGRSLRESDMAVLVRSNREAQLMQEALVRVDVHSVICSTGDLFDTAEARQMEILLRAVAEPADETAVRTALVTDLLGFGGAALHDLAEDNDAWEECLRRFHGYRDTWEQHGFIRMFREFMLAEKVRPRLLSLPGGERRLTNVLHIAEVLHAEEMHRRPGTGGLIQWLAARQGDDTARPEEHQLRLESDEEAVKVVTIHKSKGLEYPVVFCPFNWGTSRIGSGVHSFHDEADGWRLNVALEPVGDAERRAAEREQLAENIRLLYVSVTRARNRCYLVWGPIRNAETSSLAYILHPPRGALDSAVDAMEERVTAMEDRGRREELEEISASSAGTVEVAALPDEPGIPVSPPAGGKDLLDAKVFGRTVGRAFDIVSFSSLVSEAGRGGPVTDGFTELPDHDERAPAALASEPAAFSEILAFPRGTKAGKCLHAVFERIDFDDADRDSLKAVVEGALAEYGYDLRWCGTLCGMVGRVLAGPLDRDGRVTLSGLARKNCLKELPFTFPLKTLTPGSLREIFSVSDPAFADIPERIASLGFQPARGFMKGYIDLVFLHDGRYYLVDWKSNHLGNRTADYGAPALMAVMRDDLYVLQYHLYAVALHEYLRSRVRDYDYDRHFGGVFYVFLRGVDPVKAPGSGIFYDRPARRLVESLSEGLVAREM